MDYPISDIESQLQKLEPNISEEFSRVTEIVEQLNQHRDKGLSKKLQNKVRSYLKTEQVYHSNAIEGNNLTIQETQQIIDNIKVNKNPIKDEIEAKSLSMATDYLYSLIDGSESLTRRVLLDLHSLLMKDRQGIEHGIFRKEDVTLSGSKHVPPSFTAVEDHIKDMFTWIIRNSHKHNPIIISCIVKHWLTWIHPFEDGNGRVSRLFYQLFLLQKGYPLPIIKVEKRLEYYNALQSADQGDIIPLAEMLCVSISETVNIWEENINEEKRSKEWAKKYAKGSKFANVQYEKKKKRLGYEWSVFSSQMDGFKAILKDTIFLIEEVLPKRTLEFSLREYDPLTMSQYIDLLEGKEVSNTWYLNLMIRSKHKTVNFVFYYWRFSNNKKKTFSIGDVSNTVTLRSEEEPQIKLFISTKIRGKKVHQKQDLQNIGIYENKLAFGVNNTEEKHTDYSKLKNLPPPKVLTTTDNPNEVIRSFIDQVLKVHFDFDI